MGTYFPRSFAESYTIFAELIHNKFIKDNLQNKHELFILDIGSGTGGNLLGFLWFMRKFFKNKNITIISIDGSKNALSYQRLLLRKFFPEVKFRLFKGLISRNNFSDELGKILNKCQIEKFDIIMAFKFVNELYRTGPQYSKNKGMYKIVTEAVSDFIDEDGLFILTDVTDPIVPNGFLSKIMNGEILDYLNNSAANLRLILPLSCAFWYKKCRYSKSCFTQKEVSFKINYTLNSSYKFWRKSKISYKVFVHKKIVDKILSEIDEQDSYKIAKGKTCIKGIYMVHYDNPALANKYKDAFSLDSAITLNTKG